MRKLWISLAALISAALVVAPAVFFLAERASQTASETDFARLQGRWDLESIDYGDVGEPHFFTPGPGGVHLVVKGQWFNLTSMVRIEIIDRHGEVTLDASKEPKYLNLRLDSEGVMITEKALYRLERDRLSICRNRNDPTKRPEDFRADKARGIVIEIYERDTAWRGF